MSTLQNKLIKAEELLSNLRIPGYDIDMISSGVVKKLRISMDGDKIVVYIDMSDPACLFCKFINHILWSKIIEDIKQVLQREFKEVYVLDFSKKIIL